MTNYADEIDALAREAQIFDGTPVGETLAAAQTELARTRLALAEARRLNAELVEALDGLVVSIDKKMQWLNPGPQRNNFLSPVMEEALHSARAAISKAKGEA